MKKFNKIVSIVICFSVIMSISSQIFATESTPSIPHPRPHDDEEHKSDTIKLVFGGDVMLTRNVAKAVNDYGEGDYIYPFLPVVDYLKNADLAFINLESQISDKGSINLLKGPPHFRADPKAALGLMDAGIDIVTLANNHIFDYGRRAMEDCFNQLENVGIKYCGAGLTHKEAYSPVIVDVKGVKVAFLGYTNHGLKQWGATKEWTNPHFPYNHIDARSGVAWLYIKQLEKGIYKAKEIADIIIVTVHFGMNYDQKPASAQDRYAHLAIDRGADLVIGHSPHVTQPVVKYDKGYIAYSLGNFVFDQRESFMPGVTSGMLFEVTVNNKKITDVETKKTRIVEGIWQTEFE